MDERLKAFDEAREIRFLHRYCKDVERGVAGVCLQPEHVKGMIRLANARIPGEPGEWGGYVCQDGQMSAKPHHWCAKPLTPEMFTKVVLFHTHPVSGQHLQPSREDWDFYLKASSLWGWRNHVLAGTDMAIVMQFSTIKEGLIGKTTDERAVTEYVRQKERECAHAQGYTEKTVCMVREMGGNAEVAYDGITTSVVFYDEGP